jgi:hypothetical protein
MMTAFSTDSCSRPHTAAPAAAGQAPATIGIARFACCRFALKFQARAAARIV